MTVKTLHRRKHYVKFQVEVSSWMHSPTGDPCVNLGFIYLYSTHKTHPFYAPKIKS